MQKIVTLLNYLAILCAATYLCGCTSVGANSEIDPDPWEAWNKPVYNFNDKVDGYFLKPVATGYRWLMPDAGERAVTRFFGNLGEISNTVNNLLQGKPGQAANSTGRFLFNSTLGVGGLFEVAESMGLRKYDAEDFGQTLGVWGVGPGPYIVLPFLGPSNLRDAPARLVDRYTGPAPYISEEAVNYGLTVAEQVNNRVGLLESERLISGDKYLFIRDVYIQRREFLVNDGEIRDDDFDDFGDFGDFSDDDF